MTMLLTSRLELIRFDEDFTALLIYECYANNSPMSLFLVRPEDVGGLLLMIRDRYIPTYLS